tara:strand:+ start:1449 stop:1682 length:234 start_codon:yes stop_codon:yes gene_type:complete
MSRKNGRKPDVIKVDPTDLDIRAAGDNNLPYDPRDIDNSVQDNLNSGLTYLLDSISPSGPHELNLHEESINDQTLYD